MVPIAAVLALFTLGACGGGNDAAADGVASLDDGAADDAGTGSAPTATTEPVDQEEALLAFAACMRENGVDMPDPQIDDDGGVMIEIGGDEPEPGQDAPENVEQAMEECGELMPRGPIERNGKEFDPTEMQALAPRNSADDRPALTRTRLEAGHV